MGRGLGSSGPVRRRRDPTTTTTDRNEVVECVRFLFCIFPRFSHAANARRAVKRTRAI